MARPKIEIDPKAVERAASIGCTLAEIGVVCGCSQDTVERRFADAIKRGRERGKCTLRRMQWKSAQSGNVTMQIWLGKQLLSQSDKIQHAGPGDGPILTEHTEKHVVDYDAIEAELGKLSQRMAGRTPSNGNAKPVHTD